MRRGEFAGNVHTVSGFEAQVGKEDEGNGCDDTEGKITVHDRQYPAERGGVPGKQRRSKPPYQHTDGKRRERREISAEIRNFERLLAAGADEIVRVRHNFSRGNHREAIWTLSSGHYSPPIRGWKIHQTECIEKARVFLVQKGAGKRARHTARSHERKFDAVAKWINPFGAHLNAIA